MKQRVLRLSLVLGLAGVIGALSVGCGSDDDLTPSSKGGAAGAGKAGAAGKGGSGESGGSGGSKAGSGNDAGSAGEGGTAGAAGDEPGGASGAAGDHGDNAGGPSGEAGSAGAGVAYTAEQVARGQSIARALALCGVCHTASGGSELGGNPQFKGGALPASNLTPDPTGIGNWTDAQVVAAIKDGIDNEGRQLDPSMPYWLFHNMSDADALAIVAFLRGLPPVANAAGSTNPSSPVSPLSPSSLPDTTLPNTDPDYAAAVQGKYLVSGVAQCVRCHSPSSGGMPMADFFSGVPPANATTIFASNITPDVTTGIGGWSAADVVTALKVGTNKAGRVLCGSMPSAGKGYGGMSDADAHAIGVYLTTIPPISKASTDPDLEPACSP